VSAGRPGRRREGEVLEGMMLLLLLARLGEEVAARAELDQVRKAMLAYMLSTGRERVEPAICVSDFGASIPALWPDYLDGRCAGRDRSYSWDGEGTVWPCEAEAGRTE